LAFLLLTLVLVSLGVVIAALRGPWKSQRLIAMTSFVIVWVSPFLTPATARQLSDLDNLQFGGPIPFLEQHTTFSPPDTAFPIRYSRLLNPQEYPTQILRWRFWLSVVLVAGLIWLIWRAVNGLWRHIDKGNAPPV
jgi:hypothetical protein